MAGQGAPVAGLAHRPFGPLRAGRTGLSAVGTRHRTAGRARPTPRAALGHEVARLGPSARPTGGHRAQVAAVAQVTVVTTASAGDDPNPPTGRAGPSWPGRARRAQRLAPFVAPGHGLHPATARTRRRQLALSTARAHATLGRRGERPPGASAAHAGGLGQRRSSGPQLDDQAAHRRGCTGAQGSR